MMGLDLIHHSAAACSSSHTVLWIPEEDGSSFIVYASHGIINICRCFEACLTCGGPIDVEEPVWSIVETLRTSSEGENSAKRVVTAICPLKCTTGSIMGFASGFSDGTVNVWRREKKSDQKDEWTEQVLQEPGNFLSITDIDGMVKEESGNLIVVVATCTGSFLLTTDSSENYVLAKFAVNTINIQHFKDENQTLLLLGTAAPRNNKIHVFWFDWDAVNEEESGATTKLIKPAHVGYLVGHEDWLTDFAWDLSCKSNILLASGSQDARIRLWKFKTNLGENAATKIGEGVEIEDEDDEFDAALDQDEDEGEARLEIGHSQGVTRVILEALLYGHEEPITSVEWHPQPEALYKKDRILLSSSMDRTILIWASSDDSGIWSPLTRVGAAGGILGGSIGSTLLGFLGLAVEPYRGDSLIGHAYGGALHVWCHQRNQAPEEELKTSEELVLCSQWKATACMTGHFDSVTDCCWEASAGEYLLTVSNDQTCRLWGQVATRTEDKKVWVELARPQVHGYDLTTLTSISTPNHRHLLVSGADEKEIRVFDAPLKCLKMLEYALENSMEEAIQTEEIGLDRVERAYIPSLGLSNKPSSAESAKEDIDGINDDESENPHLPLERDLGAVSLWPEVGKLYGHNTELFCLTSTLTAKSSNTTFDGPFSEDILVASSTKARDVKDAAIRIWEVSRNKCLQVLSGGHKSTIAALSFSPDGKFLASSGKDRRLCIWERKQAKSKEGESDDDMFTLTAAVDSAHKRIVWAVHFCPFDPTLLASGSRDGTVKIWRIREGASGQDELPLTTATLLVKFQSLSKNNKKKSQAVTALSFAPLKNRDEEPMLAIGLENGLIELWGIGNNVCKILKAFESGICHFATVTKLCWKPIRENNDNKLILASTSADHGCRIFTINTTF